MNFSTKKNQIMSQISSLCNEIFQKVIANYHIYNEIDAVSDSGFEKGSLEDLLYQKCWVDTAQWHMEDEVRDPAILPEKALYWKRRIDAQNQIRTDMVEYIDSYFLQKFQSVSPLPNAKVNTESPAWAIDRLSILALKIFHMHEETVRTDASSSHIEACKQKLDVLLTQRKDLSQSIDELLQDIENGSKYMKVYKQMKMYNDPNLNPILYQQNQK